jgi:uncharacterized protein YegL
VETMVNCLPIYIMIDTSQSMAPFEGVLNDIIETLYDELITRPRISEFAQVSILSYNTEAEVVLRMTDLQSMDALPQLECGGITDFGKTLRLLRRRIEQDVPQLSDAGRGVLRPVAFLITDGQPTDEYGHLSNTWRPEFASLVDKSYRRHPNVVPFGYGSATVDMLNEVATIPGVAFLAKESNTGDALRKILPALLKILIASAKDRELRLPQEVDGFIRVSSKFLE